MAKFLNTSATNYFLEELIKDAKERLILISPLPQAQCTECRSGAGLPQHGTDDQQMGRYQGQ
ncbi:hypothetical protein [Aeromonas dhakensis]|uniref:hypothetical protein n=1 Tax=Aeromonas dhakensis TaxID=196024 RepID=UPI00203CC71F|nr:hypothetical protein [Aeromonas dhakensis]